MEASSSTPIIESYYFDKPHVLLVDYNPCELYGTANIFESNSWRVTKTRYESEALNIVRNEKQTPNKMPKIDMVCMEFVPGRSTRLLREIKGCAATRDMPVVILTKYSFAENMCREAGAVAYIVKPMRTEYVKGLVRLMGWQPRNVLQIEDKQHSAKKCKILNHSNKTLHLG